MCSAKYGSLAKSGRLKSLRETASDADVRAAGGVGTDAKNGNTSVGMTDADDTSPP